MPSAAPDVSTATPPAVGIDPQRGGIVVERKDGKHEALDLSRLGSALLLILISLCQVSCG